MNNLEVLQRRNKLFVKIIWFMTTLGIVIDLIIGVDTPILISLITVGWVSCGIATYMTYANKGTRYVMFVIPAILAILNFLLIYQDPDPLLSTYLLVYVNIGLMSLYSSYKPIVFAGILGAFITVYFYYTPFYHDKMFAREPLSYLLLFLIFITVAIAFAARFSEKLQRAVLDKQKDTEAAKKLGDELLAHLKQSIEVLNHLSAQLRENVNVTSSISREITFTFGQMSSTMQQQTLGLQDTAVSVREVNNIVEETSGSSTELQALSREMLQTTEAAGLRMQALSSQINGLQTIIRDTVARMKQLSDHNQQIIQIVDTIHSISTQTNLLAMNAAIEAAHAGEHGKGFAVVSAEIRKLAENSRQSTERINLILNEVIEDINNVAKQITLGNEVIEMGEEEAREVQAFMNKVADNAKSVSQQSQQVDGTVRQMQEQYLLIMKEVLSVAEGTEHNMAATEEILAAVGSQDAKIHEIVQHYEELDNLILTLTNSSTQNIKENKPKQD